MRDIFADIHRYDPRDYRAGYPGVASGFTVLLLVLGGLFLI